MPDGTYAPQSPDLSSFFSGSPPKPSPHKSTVPYAPRSPSLSSFGPSTSPNLTAPGYQPPSPLQLQHQFQPRYDYPLEPEGGQYLPPIPALPPAHSFPTSPVQRSFATQEPFAPQSYQSFHNNPPQPPRSAQFKVEEREVDMSRVKRERKANGGEGLGLSGTDVGLGPSQGIDVKTKFPVARIKRIMQADEEVGKVAQVTPVAVSKALELFMISLVTRSAALARQGGSKRVTAAHLKRAIEADDQFDFLGEIVSKVVEGPEKKERAKEEDSEDEEGVAKKKKGGRKKREG